MPTPLNHRSPIPLHYQLTEAIRKGLLSGELVDGNGKLPTEFELSEQYRVSRVTVRTALNTLLQEGLLDRRRGSGTYLRSNQPENWMGKLMGFSESIEAIGVKPGAEVLHAGLQPHPPDPVKEQLRQSEAWELKRLRFADGEPIAIEHSYFPVDIGLAIAKQPDLHELLTYRFIETELNVLLHEARQVIRAVNADRDEAERLNIAEGEALLYLERRTVSTEGAPIEWLQSVYRPDYFEYVVHLQRRG